MMLNSLKLRLYPHISTILPFFTALLIVPLPNNPALFIPVFEKFLIAFFLFVSWQALRNLYFVMRLKTKPPASDFISLILLAVATPLLLHLMKTRVETTAFYMVLVIMLASLLQQVNQRSKLLIPALISSAIYSFFAALLSFEFFKLPYSAGVILFSLSITFLCLAQYSALLIYEEPAEAGSTEKKFLGLCLTLAPLTVLGMFSFAFLSRKYVMLAVVIALSTGLISRLNSSEKAAFDKKAVFLEASSLSLLFIVIVALIKLI